jgi:hypothetical protein
MGLLREPLGDGARALLDGTAELNLYQLARTEGVVERPDDRWSDSLRADVDERVEMMGFGAKLGALPSGYCHVYFRQAPPTRFVEASMQPSLH